MPTCVALQHDQIDFDDVRAGRSDAGESLLVRETFQMDAGYCRLGAFEDNILHLLNVDAGRAHGIEHCGEHSGTVEMADYERAGSGSGSCQVNDVGNVPGLQE